MTGKRSQNNPLYLGNISDLSSSKDHDRFLPIANVSRIMKKSLPANAKISKETKETVQECVSEFISFITGEASDKCQREKRKTINGDDLLWAMTTLGFENYVSPLKVYLNKYRENEGEKTSMAREEDHPIPIANSCNDNLGEISKVSDSISTRADFQNSRNFGYYPLGGAKMTTKNYEDPGSIFPMENRISGNFNTIGRISEVEGRVNRVITTNLQYGESL